MEVEDIHQYQRRNNILITGVPQEDGENLYRKVAVIAQALEISLCDADIYTLHRLPTLYPDWTHLVKNVETCVETKRFGPLGLETSKST